MSETNYPLFWPTGWRRTDSYRRSSSRFGNRTKGVSMTTALCNIDRELRLLRAEHFVISTNIRVKPDGWPYANQARPSDPGTAIYFTLKKRRVSLACDKWVSPEENIYAIAKHIEAIRGQERWGVGSIEQAFAGYAALPHRTGPSCWDVLGLEPGAIETAIRERYKTLVKTCHPDAPGGSSEKFSELQEAVNIAIQTNK